RRREGTLRFTRGMSGPLLHVGRGAAEPPGVLTGQDEQFAVLPLPARALMAEQVALLCVRPNDLAGLGHAKALGRRAMGAKFWHRSPLTAARRRRRLSLGGGRPSRSEDH